MPARTRGHKSVHKNDSPSDEVNDHGNVIFGVESWAPTSNPSQSNELVQDYSEEYIRNCQQFNVPIDTNIVIALRTRYVYFFEE
jgi:hypothetical protein